MELFIGCVFPPKVVAKKDTVKIEWHVTNHTATLSEIMMNALKYSGAEQYLGAGPKNPNERKIGNFLSKKKGQQWRPEAVAPRRSDCSLR